MKGLKSLQRPLFHPEPQRTAIRGLKLAIPIAAVLWVSIVILITVF